MGEGGPNTGKHFATPLFFGEILPPPPLQKATFLLKNFGRPSADQNHLTPPLPFFKFFSTPSFFCHPPLICSHMSKVLSRQRHNVVPERKIGKDDVSVKKYDVSKKN